MADEGTNRLAQVMQERMRKNQDANGALVLDFGSIQADMSLKTNTFSIPIPQRDYHVARQLTLGSVGSGLTSTGYADGHSHTVGVPEKMRSIRPGDRVLVAWVQSEAVVIDIIMPGTAV